MKSLQKINFVNNGSDFNKGLSTFLLYLHECYSFQNDMEYLILIDLNKFLIDSLYKIGQTTLLDLFFYLKNGNRQN